MNEQMTLAFPGNEIPRHEAYRLDNENTLQIIIEYDMPTKDGERLQVAFIRSINDHSSASLADSWFREGKTPTRLETWWSVTTYCYGERGCTSKYNPTMIRSIHHNEKGDYVVPVNNYEWILEATEENMERILAEIERQTF